METAKDPQRVHIVPIGLEIDRATLPLKDRKADKAILLTQRNPDEYGQYFLNEVKSRIKEVHPSLDYEIQYFEKWDDLSNIMSKFIEIVYKEKEKSNMVFINVSSGGTLANIAGAMVALMEGVEAYYVCPKEYTIRKRKEPITEGYKKSLKLPKEFEINRPSEELVFILQLIDERNRVQQKDLVPYLIEKDLLETHDENGKRLVHSEYEKKGQPINNETLNVLLAKFRRKYLYTLKDNDWIKIEGQRRASKIHLTPRGGWILKTFKTGNKYIT